MNVLYGWIMILIYEQLGTRVENLHSQGVFGAKLGPLLASLKGNFTQQYLVSRFFFSMKSKIYLLKTVAYPFPP